MEFLDDILGQQGSSKEPQESEPEDAQTPASPEATSDAWEELLAGVSYEEPAEDELPPVRRHRAILSPLQKAILGGLTLAVVVVWGVLAVTIARGRSTRPDPAAQATAMVSTAEDETLPETAVEPAEEENPASPATAVPTPTPGLAVFTRFDRQIEQDPNNRDLYLRRGEEYLSMGAYQAARGDFEKALALDNTSPLAYVGLGWVEFYLWNWDQAKRAFNAALTLDPQLSQAYYGIGRLNYLTGNYAGAAAAYDQAAEINPQDAEAEAWLAIAAARRGDRTEASDAVGRALAQDDSLAIVYVAQSWARRVQDPPDIDGAQADLLYAQELRPNAFVTLNELAQFYADFRPERLVEAEQLALYARNWATNEVDRAVALHTLGSVYLKQGRQADAQRVLSEAAEMATVDGEILIAGLAEDLTRAQE